MKYIINKINYDKKYDVLNVAFFDTSNSYGDEDVDNIVWLKDIDSDKVTGITIINFIHMVMKNDYKIQELTKCLDVSKLIEYTKTIRD